MKIDFTVSPEENGLTVGELLKKRGVSRRLIIALKQVQMGITKNGEHIRVIDRVQSGDIISITREDETEITPNGSLKAEIVYDDDQIVIFNKPANMPVHPSHRHREDTLANLFAYIYPGLTFRAINRLDRDTTGLCVVAKTAYAANALQGKVEKVYYALVHGDIASDGSVDAPIARERESIITRCVRSDGQRAVTNYKVVKRTGEYTLLKIHLETGRTHQIRVHMAYIGHPLVGDGLYGTSSTACGTSSVSFADTFSKGEGSGHLLHCGELSFTHPMTGEEIHFVINLPKEITALL